MPGKSEHSGIKKSLMPKWLNGSLSNPCLAPRIRADQKPKNGKEIHTPITTYYN